MSYYSYLNTVFPNYEYKTNPNLRLFNSLDAESSQTNDTLSKKEDIFEPSNTEIKRQMINIVSNNPIQNNIPIEKNNLNVYNKPLTIIENLKDVNKQGEAEAETGIDEDECLKWINHIHGCKLCKLRYNNNNNNKNENDELFEIITYIIFSTFIIFLIDKLSK